MIELIFVIVIIGILAAVAIPKLSATRDDAKVAEEVTNLSTCISVLGGKYTATGELSATAADTIVACKHLDCFQVASTNDGNGTITVTGSSATDPYCIRAREVAEKQKLDGNHSFGDRHTVF